MPEALRRAARVLAYLSHQIDCGLAKLVLQIIPLYHTYTVLACGSAFHFYCTLDHVMDQILGDIVLFVVVQQYGFGSSVSVPRQRKLTGTVYSL